MRAIAALPLIALASIASAPGHPDGAQLQAQLNAIRVAPAAYAASLRVFRGYFDAASGTVYHVPGDPTGHVTREGTRAVDEAITAVSSASPVPTLVFSAALTRAARTHVEAQGPSGAVGHGSGAGGMAERIAAAGGGGGFSGETISYGAASPADAIRQLIVDDGVASRGHREILLSANYRYVGIWCGPHAAYGTMCVLDFSSVPGTAPRAG